MVKHANVIIPGSNIYSYGENIILCGFVFQLETIALSKKGPPKGNHIVGQPLEFFSQIDADC